MRVICPGHVTNKNGELTFGFMLLLGPYDEDTANFGQKQDAACRTGFDNPMNAIPHLYESQKGM
jgi:hypothetical protein